MTAGDIALSSRMLVLEFDSARQRERFAVADDPRDAVAALTGMLRAALLLSDRILLTDSMVLDGIYFAHMPPDALARALGVGVEELPITIICSHATLGDSLRAKKRDRGFVWQLDGRITGARRRAHFAAWAEAGAVLPTEPYRPLVAFVGYNPQWRSGLSAAAQSHLDDVVDLTRRSRFARLHARARAEHPDDADLVEVGVWWESAYLIAIADSVEGAWLRFDAPPPSSDGLRGPSLPGRHRLHVSAEVTEMATAMTPAMFSVVRYLTRKPRTAVHAKPTGLRMRNLTYAIKKPLETPRRVQAIASAAIRLAIGVAAVGVALPVFDDVFPAAEVAWLAFAVVAVASIPWDAVATLFEWLDRDEAIVSIRSEER